MKASRPFSSTEPEWASWPDEQILDLRMYDLKVRIVGSQLGERITQLYRELESRSVCFRPHFWLSDDWFTPDGIPGIAVPFYMSHPRLELLELNQMLEVEGGTPEWCMRILRHETGHAIDNAYRLRRRRQRQQVFGRSSEPYPEYYTPRPYSKSFVLHLDSWYAQSHPDEDFSETFAVWLNPHSMWRERYASWPALKKLEYVDALMAEIGDTPPPRRSRRKVDQLSTLGTTLREHYDRKRAHYSPHYPDIYDRELRMLFSDQPKHKRHELASAFLRRNRAEIRRLVARWTGEYQFTLEQVLNDMIGRCRELKLRAVGSERSLLLEFAVLLSVKTVHFLHSRRNWIAL